MRLSSLEAAAGRGDLESSPRRDLAEEVLRLPSLEAAAGDRPGIKYP
ncbi:MAG: hypothetical protein R3B09_02640 [Nannocystaceae bacterium]